MMPLANEDAAEFGFPGRTEMVGSRQTRPSTYPLREYSLTSSSPMAFVAPVSYTHLTLPTNREV